MVDARSMSPESSQDDEEMRVDDLARAAGVATTTIRLYQSKGLLAPPRLVGRTGWYDQRHLSRLRVIARLQDQGFSLAAIGALLERWERGEGLAGLVGAEGQIGNLLGHRRAEVLTAEELLEWLPVEALDVELIARAAALGLVTATDDGRFRVPDVRFLETGSTLARLGVPLGVVLDEWEHLRGVTDAVAERFAALFEEHLLPADWRERLDDGDATAFVETLGELRNTGERVLLAALDDSIARVAAARFSELLPAEHID
jgi:DNA-binding transcriptional MerR regulator